MSCRRRWRSAVLLALLSGACSVGAQPQLHTDGLSAAEISASQRLLDDGWALLTPAWRQALSASIVVQWTDALPAHVHGRALRKRLLLDHSLLQGWMQASMDSRDPARRAALAALVHELAHFLDRGMRLSHQPRLRDLAGWQRQPWRPWRGQNRFIDRSPDHYELSDTAEFVAVNLEHFLLDHDYACRRPALAAWFTTHLGQAHGVSECASTLPFLQADSADGDVSPLLLDPARIYQVDYLLAEGNEQAVSLWGHSMLRLVICAPGRVPGPDCRLDLNYHRVLSFRAFVGDVQISSWRGLTGSYPSRLFVLPLTQVVDEYTKMELRGLSSVPLRLRRDEIAALMERVARVHWSYDGRYFFVGNNCAVETWKLLHDGIERMAALPLSGITPRGLLRRLRRSGVADTSVLGDHAEAVRRGYYFDSAAANYQAMFELVQQSLALPQRDLGQWLALPPQQRRQAMGTADLPTSAALLLLEQAAQRRLELQWRDSVKRRLLRGRGERTQAQLASLYALLDNAGVLTRPAAMLDGGGYGVPQANELQQLAAVSQQRSQQQLHGWKALREWTRAGLPEKQRAELAEVDANLDFIGERLRSLHTQAGGLTLPSLQAQGDAAPAEASVPIPER